MITHGNGPQVGNELIRQERAADEAPPLPLWLAVAQTQAEIGALIEAELRPRRGARSVPAHARARRRDDPAFDRPTKPIGPFYSAEQRRAAGARARLGDGGRDANRGHAPRRPVPAAARDRRARRRSAGCSTTDASSSHAEAAGFPSSRGDAPRRRRRGDRQGPRVRPARGGLGAERLIILTDVPRSSRLREPGREELRSSRGATPRRCSRAGGGLDASEGGGRGPFRTQRAARP